MVQHVVNSFSKKEKEQLISFFKSKDTLFNNNKLVITRKVSLGCKDCCFKNGEIVLDHFSICNNCNDKWVYNIKVLNLKLIVTCISCKKDFNLFINQKDFNDYKTGEFFIQDILHYLNKDDRELIISQTCTDCWNEIFKSTEDE